MNGIKMSDCKFYVNEEKRTVVCVIPNTRDLLHEFIFDNFRFSDFDFDWALMNQELVEMPSSFMGKAVCSQDDEWNEKTGRLIAFARAKTKCYNSFFKRANHVVQVIDGRLGDMVEAFNKFGEKLDENRKKLEEDIAYLTDGE